MLADEPNVLEYHITEKTLTENFEKVFGYKCDIFAKLIYVKLSGNKDCATINFPEFLSLFMPLLNENRDKRNRCVFNILNSSSDGVLHIISLL